MKKIFFCLLLLYSTSFAQWAELVLPSNSVPFYSTKYPMGNNNMIFAIDTSNIIYGFDQNTKVWTEYSSSTTLNWVTGKGGGNVCMLLNDSVVVAYSSVLSQFKELRFNGTLLTLPGSGWTSCDENSGVIITTEKIYVYDALINNWSSTDLNDYSILAGIGNHIRDDFLFITLALNTGYMKVVTYSLITKTFAEFTKENFPIRRLDHGFCILAYSSSNYIAGYSAFTGVFNEITNPVTGEQFFDSSPATDREKVSEIVLEMFYKISALDSAGNVTLTSYVYNTLTGQFYSNSFTYNYPNSGFYIKVGGNFTALAFYHYPENKITLKIFRASDNSFYSLDVPIYIIANTPGLLIVGKDVFWIWDNTNLIAVNAITGETGQMTFSDTFPTTPPFKVNIAGDDWGVWAYRSVGSDIVKIYSFSGDVTNIAYREVQASLGVTQGQYDKIGFIMFQNPGNYKKWSAFSPIHNEWYDFESTTSTNDYQSLPGNYAVVHYYSKGKLELYDPVTNEVKIYPNVSSYSYRYQNKNHLIMYNVAAQYIGFSAIEHSDKVFQANQYYGLLGEDDICFITPTGTLLNTYTRIIYDGYRNNFAGLKIADSLGTLINGRQSGKFCFFATMSGHVFAYTGEEGSVVNVELENFSNNGVEGFSLSQNYPNPFNPSTKISWQSPVGSHQTLKVFDVLGNEIATLVDEYKPAGNYEVEFKSAVGNRQLASGIYFYQLKAMPISKQVGQFIQTKKMILIK